MRNIQLPTIGTKGSFKFTAPFDTLLKSDVEYIVSGIRNLIELEKSEEQPYNTMYVPVGLTKTEFKEDVDQNIPIVVLSTPGGEYVYVPADRILSIPDVTGVKYQEQIVAVSLGGLPVTYDMTLLKSLIKNTVYEATGINTTTEIITASAVTLKPKVEHDTYMALLENRATVNKSYKTRYLELLTLFNKKTQVMEDLKDYIINKLNNPTT